MGRATELRLLLEEEYAGCGVRCIEQGRAVRVDLEAPGAGCGAMGLLVTSWQRGSAGLRLEMSVGHHMTLGVFEEMLEQQGFRHRAG